MNIMGTYSTYIIKFSVFELSFTYMLISICMYPVWDNNLCIQNTVYNICYSEIKKTRCDEYL